MLYGRPIRTKLPELKNHKFECNDLEIIDRNPKQKGKGKVLSTQREKDK